jgi:WD40 repeat protein
MEAINGASASGSASAVKASPSALEHPSISAALSAAIASPLAFDETQDPAFPILRDFLVTKCKLLISTASKYATALMKANVGSVDRLIRNLVCNKRFLHELGFDEDDADDILATLFPSSADTKQSTASTETQVPTPKPSETTTAGTSVTSPAVNRTPTLSMTLEGHSYSVYSVTQLRDGRLCSGSDDNTIKIWSPATGQCEKTLDGHTSCINVVIQLRDGRLCSGSDDKTIKLWSLSNYEEVNSWNNSDFKSNALAFDRKLNVLVPRARRMKRCDLKRIGQNVNMPRLSSRTTVNSRFRAPAPNFRWRSMLCN